MAGKTPEKMTDTTDVSTTELAMILGVTARRVQQMAQDGTLPTVQRGRFLLAESVTEYTFFHKYDIIKNINKFWRNIYDE